MEAFPEDLQAASINIVLNVIIQYRFLRRSLGHKYSSILTFIIMLAGNFFAGWLNVSMHIATDIGGNSLYYSFFTLALCLLLFKGRIVKKIFLTVLTGCGISITFYLFLPFAHYFLGHTKESFFTVLKLLQIVDLLICAVGMEYIGKKFQNLSRELPLNYTVYLTGVILFVYVAIYSAYDRMIIISQSDLSLSSALTMVVFALAGTFITFVAIFAVDRQVNVSLKEQLHIIQAENFKSRELEWRRFSGFRHDIKNHLICLNNLLESKKTEQATAYMRNLTDTVKQFDHSVLTGNDYADALLNAKYAQALAAKIAVSIEMAIPPQGFIDPVDLCCILSNAFDNAIAACSRMTEGEKWITARAFIKQGQFVITIKNSKPAFVTVIDGEVFPKRTTADHGLGLDTVKMIVQKYDGILKLSADDAFTFSVLLPSPRL